MLAPASEWSCPIAKRQFSLPGVSNFSMSFRVHWLIFIRIRGFIPSCHHCLIRLVMISYYINCFRLSVLLQNFLRVVYHLTRIDYMTFTCSKTLIRSSLIFGVFIYYPFLFFTALPPIWHANSACFWLGSRVWSGIRSTYWMAVSRRIPCVTTWSTAQRWAALKSTSIRNLDLSIPENITENFQVSFNPY